FYSFYCVYFLFFLFNHPSTTEIYTLSLHDALPILDLSGIVRLRLSTVMSEKLRLIAPRMCNSSYFSLLRASSTMAPGSRPMRMKDRKSTRLNSSHVAISYAVFCLKKKKKKTVGNDQ